MRIAECGMRIEKKSEIRIPKLQVHPEGEPYVSKGRRQKRENISSGRKRAP